MNGPIGELHQSLPWDKAEAMTVERVEGRIVTDRPFPEIISISDQLEAAATGPRIRRAREYLVFRLDNGGARYRLLGRQKSSLSVEPRRGRSLWQLEATTGYTPVPTTRGGLDA